MAKEVVEVTGPQLHQTDRAIEFVAPTTGPYWVDITFNDPRVAAKVSSWVDTSPSGENGAIQPAAHHWMGANENPDRPDLFPAPYRRWAYAGYNGEGDRATANINKKDLLFNQDDYPGKDDKPTKWDDENYKNPIQGKAYPFAADTESGTWIGPKQSSALAKGAIWGGPGRSSASRIGPDTATMTLADGYSVPREANAPTISGKGDVDAFGAGVSLDGAGVGTGVAAGKSQGQVDFVNLNGDAYPDVVGEDIQHTNEVGGLTSSSDWDGDVRMDHEFAHSFGSEGSPVAVPMSASGDTNTGQQAGNPPSPSDRAGKGVKGAKSGSSSAGPGGGGDPGGNPGGKGGGAGGGGSGKKAKKKAPNGGGDGGNGGAEPGNKTDVGPTWASAAS